MANMPDPNNRVLSVRISRELYRRLQNEAQRRGIGFSEFIRQILAHGTKDIELTEEDYEQIERERDRYIKRQGSASGLS